MDILYFKVRIFVNRIRFISEQIIMIERLKKGWKILIETGINNLVKMKNPNVI